VAIEPKAVRQHLSLWLYIALAAFSLLLAVVFPGPLLLIGVLIGMVGAFVGAFARSEPTRFQGVRVLAFGLAVLVGPVVMLAASAVASN